MPSEERYWSFWGDNLSGRFLPPRELGIQTSLLNHFCSRQKMNYFHMTSLEWRSAKDHFSAFDLLLSQFWMVRRDQIQMPLFPRPSNIYLSSKSDCALRQDWALSFENRNLMHCTAIRLYWKPLSKYVWTEMKLLFLRVFSPTMQVERRTKKLFCSGKKSHLIKSSYEILNAAWHEACKCKWLSATRNERSRD